MSCKNYLKYLGILPVLFFISCAPQRKKMPGFISDAENFEKEISFGKQEQAPFIVTDSAFYFNGKTLNCISISIPDETNDSLALSLLNAYFPMAQDIFFRMCELGKGGIIINMAKSTSCERAIFQISEVMQKQIDLPVIVLWDKYSEPRARKFINTIDRSVFIKYHLVGNDRATLTKRKIITTDDCFSFREPILGE
jgi:hypothetical protein